MFNPTEIPSLSKVLDTQIPDVEVVPGKVTSLEGNFFLTFSIASDDLKRLTGREVFNLYLKPAAEALGKAVAKYADGDPICTKAHSLPEKGSKILGFRCFKGKIPVNVYIARRMNPDRHQFVIECLVQKAPECEENSSN